MHIFTGTGLTPNIDGKSSTTSTLSVSWSHPTTNYNLVTNYEVQWKVVGDSSFQTSKNLDKTSNNYTVSDRLMSGQLYTVVVIAHVKLTSPDDTLILSSSGQTERLGMF